MECHSECIANKIKSVSCTQARPCHSERSEESLRGRWCLDPDIILPIVILHCVQNDKVKVALLYPTI